MTNMDDLLDFEFEEPRSISPAITKKKKKVIGLDDLLADYYKEQSKLLERETKRAKSKKRCDSDGEMDEDATEAEFSKCVKNCQKQIGQISGDDEMPLWGLPVFGDQMTLPPLEFPEIGSCELLQSFRNHELNSLVELDTEKGETFLEGLLAHGWLRKLVFMCGRVEKSIASWTFNLMLYSLKEVLISSAYEFWCAILLPKDENQVDLSSVQIDWLPDYIDLRRALEIYGFQLDSLVKLSSDGQMVQLGPPQNIRCWIKYVAVCCQAREAQLMFSTLEVEDLIVQILSLFLDRQLLGLSIILHECMLAAINFFKEDEWHTSCLKVAKSLACRLPADVNCLRIVESISGVDVRSKHLRSAVAFQFLVTCLDTKVHDAEEVLKLLISIKVKDQNCDLLKMYIYISLAENWLLCDRLLKDMPVIQQMWGVCLRNCSYQITSSDLRSYASKVRSKASFLLQGTSSK